MTISLNSLRTATPCISPLHATEVFASGPSAWIRATKHPLGQPPAFEHFHNSAGRAAAFFGGSNLSVAHDKILIDLKQVHSDIWMTQIP
jgi:hypothetical protein